MKSSKGQVTVILLLMLALFMQMEGMIPNIFAGDEEPIVLTKEIDGMEIEAEIESKNFNNENELVIKASFINKGSLPISYYASTATYGMRSAVGVALISLNGKSKFTDRFVVEAERGIADSNVLQGELMPGKSTSVDFKLQPFYMENGSVKMSVPGDYTLRIWYNKGVGEAVCAEFPVAVVKRFGKMYIKA